MYDLGRLDKAAGAWMVYEGNPWPDLYIAITFGDEETLRETSKMDGRIFHQLDEALSHARMLQERYSVRQIRLFYPNQISLIVNRRNKTGNI